MAPATGPRSRRALVRDQGGIEDIKNAAEFFDKRELPGRLPYKLRTALPTASVINSATNIDGSRREQLIFGLVCEALDGAKEHAALVPGMWRAGLDAPEAKGEPEKSLAGLLLARAMAGQMRKS